MKKINFGYDIQLRYKKIRNGTHILEDVEIWRNANIKLEVENLERSQRGYVKIWVPPYSHLQIGNSAFPQPSGLIRHQITEALLDIYDSWKISLDKLDQPYYLKIWLYDQRFSNSQVVCAIGDFLNFYDTTFHKPDEQKLINPYSYGKLSDRIENLNWEYAWDEEHYDNTSIGEIDEYATDKDYYETRRWFNKRLKKPHRLVSNRDPQSDIKEYYSFRHGTVWIGGE